MQAFPYATIWNSDISDQGYDVVMLGQAGPMQIDLGQIQSRLDHNPAVRDSLAEVELGSAACLAQSYAGQGTQLQRWLWDAEINRDRSLRLQYLAGLALDQDDRGDIFGALISHRVYPDQLFITTEDMEAVLRNDFMPYLP